MRRHLKWTLALSAIFAVALAGMAVAKPTVVTFGNLIFKIESSISPKALPKKELAPITFKIGGSISTKDGSHPPAAKTVNGEIDKNGALNTKGLATCRQGQLEARTTKDAEKACEDALIGEGEAEAEVAFPEQAPFDASGPLRLYNGGTKGGKTLILIHFYANVPAPTAFITPVTIKKVNHGRYGLAFESKIPVVAGGSGSLTRFSITNKRFFNYKGKKQSYFLAKCPTGRLFGEGVVSLTDGSRLKGSVVVPCTPKG